MDSQIKNLNFLIETAIKSLGVDEKIEITIDVPTDSSHGDYSINVSFRLSKILKKNPAEIAKEICEKLKNQNSDYRAEPLNGFINFWISDKHLIENVKKIVVDPKDFGKTDLMQGKKVVVEFTDPNPFKEFHIGHVYTNTVGESLSRIFEANGAIVWRADYFGDVGMHVAKAIWG
ncbi:MAG: arginine--tRNA ligase, partial [Patescibacteria group bacterium]|nr:arginine--tRNA ligase [Patescibacteria group bacterium]